MDQSRSIDAHSDAINSIVYSPTGRVCATGSSDRAVRVWDGLTWSPINSFATPAPILEIKWSPDGRFLAAATTGDVLYVWDYGTGRLENVLEGHTDTANSLSFSHDGQFLATRSLDNTVRIWRCDIWETTDILNARFSDFQFASVGFHPTESLLAVTTDRDRALQLLAYEPTQILRTARNSGAVHYANAKVVLVGDSGVGKSGLGLVLTSRPFAPTLSTHGRHVWMFESQSVTLLDGRRETRETLLWDLAGQPGYRIIHQLHLNEITLALVVFDAQNSADPLTGARHWVRALRRATSAHAGETEMIKKFLVEARVDRGSAALSRPRLNEFLKAHRFDGFFRTSAKDGIGISELIEAIRDAINWTLLPKVRSTALFSKIKTFLVSQKEGGGFLSTASELFRAFVRDSAATDPTGHLRAQFDTCMGQVESRGLIRQLSFGDLVLLQPEYFDAYASAIVNAAMQDSDGLGSVRESDVREGRFLMSRDERIEDAKKERLLLIATIEDLLRHEIALRETVDDAALLVFPSQLTRENPELPDPDGKTVAFRFEGPVENIYATLVVRLSHSVVFQRKELWKHAAAYSAKTGGTCGMFVREEGEGSGELTLFFDQLVGEEMRFHFEDYVETHLRRRAAFDSIRRRDIVSCEGCKTVFTEQQVSRRREREFDWIPCSVCDQPVPLPERQRGGERFTGTRVSKLKEIDRAADVRRERAAGAYVLKGKVETNDFDVFMCHNSADNGEVKGIGEALKLETILPWLDEWELRPGSQWQTALEEQIGSIKAAAVFVGRNGLGPWQNQELAAFLREFVRRKCPVIPVVLRSCGIGAPVPKLPLFLEGMMWVDFRSSEPHPLEQLIWGITGKRRELLQFHPGLGKT